MPFVGVSASVRKVPPWAPTALAEAVMTVMDEPQEGPHVYEVKAAVTTEDGETRVCHIDAAPRQLGLLKLPVPLASSSLWARRATACNSQP